jgi:tetratricopeptide (TPR) repeat protein
MKFKVRSVDAVILLLVALSSSIARGDTAADLAKMLTQFDALYDANKTAAAEAVGKNALALAEKTKDPRDIITWLDRLTALYRAAGRYTDAEPYSKRALEQEGKYSGTDHLNYAQALTNRANLLADQDKNAEAEPLFKRALAISQKKLGADANAGLQLGDLLDATWSEPISRNNPGHAKYVTLHRRSW